MKKKDYRVEVECKTCHVRYKKQPFELKSWNGNCAKCARRETGRNLMFIPRWEAR